MADNSPNDQKWFPEGQPQELEHPGPELSLAWRNAAIGACCLTVIIVGVQIFRANFEGSLRNEPAQTCHLRSGSGQLITGRVTSFLPPQDALNTIEFTQGQTSATISPDYIAQRRVRVEVPSQGGRRPTVLIPDGMAVQVGDTVEFVSGHKAPGLPCHYIPNLIGRVVH